jgi:dienelactone hydrolase
MVYLWYPAARSEIDVSGAYFPGAREIDAVPGLQRRMLEEFGNHWPSVVSGAVASHALENPRPADDPSRFPVVIFSHGNGSTGFGYTSLIEDLVSHGYVVAAVEHSHTSVAVRFPDGRIVPFRDEKMPPGLSGVERFQLMMKSASAGIEEGAADIRFVVQRLEELSRSGPERFLLAGRLDLKRAAAMGHSAGGAFAARACQLEPALKACVDLDGGMAPVAALPVFPDGAVMKQPLLLLEAHTTEAQMSGTREELQEYFRKKEQQLQSCAAGSYNVILKSSGMAHPSFSDIPLFFAGTQGYPEASVVRRNHRLIQSFIRAFLDKNLQGRKAPLIDEASHPEATVRRYGG